jgi:hypothetical protein
MEIRMSQRQQILFSSALSGNLKQSELATARRIIVMESLAVQFSLLPLIQHCQLLRSEIPGN